MRRRVTILGSTGSIGKSALDVVRHYPDRFDVVGLAAHSNVALLAEQVREFSPEYVAIGDPSAAKSIAELLPGVRVASGADAIVAIAAAPADIVLCGMVGAAGLRPVLSAIDAGNTIALANKEPLVMAGPLIMAHARAKHVNVLPVDSEHNAIFQCLHGHRIEDVQCIHLTASGGPFYGKPRETLLGVTPAQATRHPTWDMGAKISVDSATLMNKGLEVIEAMWLFGLPLDKIEVVIHPQSIVHSLVEFTDGSILAHLGLTNMKFPIQYALTWPERVAEPMGRLDLTTMRELTFAKPDFSEFPCLAYAMEAAQAGGTAPAILNAANESAVDAFCKGRIEFLRISEVVRDVLDECPASQDVTLEAVLDADRQARARAVHVMAGLGV
ncbi:MAG TPA: 1-deoxy-D-xylulose-5-phosphate reductoisomerase [Candidatus Hydrogenedentes bacterium]|nr:1-deoxy-D-xylulose-5-phosphate reductoisomerase [Candidatus Hydrogenedentota bacterium]